MDTTKEINFEISEIKLDNTGLDNSNVQSGCWGQAGGDNRNLC